MTLLCPDSRIIAISPTPRVWTSSPNSKAAEINITPGQEAGSVKAIHFLSRTPRDKPRHTPGNRLPEWGWQCRLAHHLDVSADITPDDFGQLTRTQPNRSLPHFPHQTRDKYPEPNTSPQPLPQPRATHRETVRPTQQYTPPPRPPNRHPHHPHHPQSGQNFAIPAPNPPKITNGGISAGSEGHF